MTSALLLTAAYLLSAALLSPPSTPTHFRTLALPRKRMRALANRLGVGQRTLYFALVTYALYRERSRTSRKAAVTASYTMLDPNRLAEDDAFFRVRTLETKFPMRADFTAYLDGVDRAMAQTEERHRASFQLTINAMFSQHRRLQRIAPWLYGPRFWRFRGVIDLVLTMVPPHRAMGPIAAWLTEPIFCGAYHPSANICTLCPGREYMTLNFAMDEETVKRVDDILPLIATVEAMVQQDQAALPPPRPETPRAEAGL